MQKMRRNDVAMTQRIKVRSHVIVCLVLLLTTAACSTAANGSSSSSTATSSSPATVTVNEATTAGSLPANFSGFSYEAGTLPNVTSFNASLGNLVALYRLLGPSNIRIGGNSVDRQTFWQPGNLAVPSWATALVKPTDIDRLTAFTQATRSTVELAVNLGHLDPDDIKSEAQYAATTLGDHLQALECGNEPNDFRNDLRPASYNVTQYKADFTACANAIGQSIAIAGPDTTGTFIANVSQFGVGHVTMLTQHAYTLNHCSQKSGSVGDLLSAASDKSEVSKIANTLKIAHNMHLPLRIDESNSANCGGIAGVSDGYASALWAVDYILLLAQNGVAGVNFHGDLGICSPNYSPLCASSRMALQNGIFTPQPLYYGMLFTNLLGAGQFYQVSISTTRNLTAYALNGLDAKTRVMLIEKDDPSSDPLNVTLHAGSGNGTAQVLHLNGSKLNSNQSVNIQGATVDQDGHFAPHAPDQLQGNNGTYTLNLAAGSAALITLPA